MGELHKEPGLHIHGCMPTTSGGKGVLLKIVESKNELIKECVKGGVANNFPQQTILYGAETCYTAALEPLCVEQWLQTLNIHLVLYTV